VRVDIDAAEPADVDDPVDIRELLGKYTVEELAETADEYYRQNLEGVDYYFAKPSGSIDEAPDLMICFAQVLSVVRPLPGMRVLDFGAGTGWTSRILNQLGCEVVVCDVSATALTVAEQLFERQPVAGDQPAPSFLRFDGHRLDLPDESIDRIFCIDAFHHLANPADTLREMARVLRPGGVAGFQEPGPNHSRKAQSQFEMRNYVVVENDIRMRDIARWARAAGFDDVSLSVFTSEAFSLSIDEYEDFLGHGSTVDRYYEHVRRFVSDRRIFFLTKGAPAVSDSRDRRGLHARLAADRESVTATTGGVATVRLDLENTGTATWLPSSAPLGPVRVGVHLYSPDGKLLDRDHQRIDLPGTEGVPAGSKLTVDLDLGVPDEPGDYVLGIDLVAEHVCWFEINEVRPVMIRASVTD
jgi:SAM-dependent methyltransferase